MTRRFSTADLENLTEGTTPGPWEWHDSDDPDMRFIYGEEGHMCISVEASGSDYRDADPRLAAAAPELAAEHHRIITALEAWLRDEQDVLNTADLTDPADQILIVGAQVNIKNIRRILNGENHT